MKTKVLFAAVVGLLLVSSAFAEIPHWKVKDVTTCTKVQWADPAHVDADALKNAAPCMKGYGLSVFQGDEPERFEVDILGVVNDGLAPGYPYILARAYGGPGNILSVIDNVAAGMSGSPIYVDGKLVGALSFADQFGKGGVFGITPFEYMEEESRRGGGKNAGVPKPAPAGKAELPFRSFSSEETSEGPRSARLAFSVSRPKYEEKYDNTKKLVPGASLSVAITTGDVTIVGTGTVTAIDGNKVYAFGHSMRNGGGETSLQGWRSPIAGVVPSVKNSFKEYGISWRGERALITHDGLFGIYGTVTDAPADMTPIEISFGGDVFIGKLARKEWLIAAAENFVYTALAGHSSFTERTALRFDGAVKFKDLPQIFSHGVFSYDVIA